MTEIILTPYEENENKQYLETTKLVISASVFENVPFKGGQSTFSFIGCTFTEVEIENKENIDFGDILIFFQSCIIDKLTVKDFKSPNISLYFGGCIISGLVKNKNLKSIELNNCILKESVFLIDIHYVRITYTEQNIIVDRWKNLISNAKKSIQELLANEMQYYINDCRKILYSVNEDENMEKGIYSFPQPYGKPKVLGFRPTVKERKLLKVGLSISFNPEKEHRETKIIQGRLLSLSLKGYCTGEVRIENSRIDNWYLRDFSSERESVFYNILPYRIESQDRKLEIHGCNLDGVLFDNVSFSSYSIIAFYRNKLGKTSFTSCDFPNRFKDFEKFTVARNVHKPNEEYPNYFKTRYETFLQLRKVLDGSENSYEALKLYSVSNHALMKIEGLPKWDRFILCVNSLSNDHGLSIVRPVGGIIFFSVVLYILYLLSLGKIFNSNEIDWNLFGYYVSFLDITHRTDFLVSKESLNGFSLVIDYANKVLVSFFIYQFVAAFRKYGRK